MTSAEDQEILAKISHLAGQINRKKNQQAGLVPGPSHYHPYHRMSTNPSIGSIDGRVDRFVKDASYGNRHRGGYSPRGRPPTHRHRSLVLNGTSPQKPSEDSSASNGWITKTDRHLQLINTSVYEKEAQARTRAIEQTRRQKQAARDERERSKLLLHLNHVNPTRKSGDANDVKHEVEIQGIRFIVANNGSKLVKAPGDNNLPKTTPKMATVGGVKFYRSKNGNLYRHGIVKAQRQSGAVKKVNVPCKTFSATGILLFRATPKSYRVRRAPVGLSPTDCVPGSCSKGPRCRYLHDPARVAVCTHFLQKMTCFNGDSCDLSHDLTPQRVPTCMHFMRDGCTKSNCRYAHNKTSHSAPVCRAFGLYGYCEQGLECPDRHVFECPDFSNKGKCKTKGCKLPHRERASVLRKADENSAADDEQDMEDLSSDDDGDSVDSYDVDSDEVDEFIGQDQSGDSSFADQRDFIEL